MKTRDPIDDVEFKDLHSVKRIKDRLAKRILIRNIKEVISELYRMVVLVRLGISRSTEIQRRARNTLERF